jgi:flagellar hook-basal body complex protein FliE
VRVEPILPDAPALDRTGDGLGFSQVLDALGETLIGASTAEDDFAHGRRTLHDAIYERAQADVALSVATATAQRVTQAVQSVLNMQV